MNSAIQIIFSFAMAMGITSSAVPVGLFQSSYGGSNGAQVVFQEETQKEKDILSEQAGKIDAYFKERSMPLCGFGKKMVTEAREHGIDWRLLPAIAIQESSGGKEAFGNNPFGWGHANFKNFDEAIATIAMNLGGDNPNTADYYSGDTLHKLYHYNGTVAPAYPSEVLAKMDAIGEK